MIKGVILASLSFFIIAKKASAQDTASVFFKNKNVVLFNKYHSVRWEPNDSESNDTIIFIGSGKFFYLRRSERDSLPIECGQLGLYRISNRLHLLREGMWILEGMKEKLFFGNTADDNIFIDEFQVDTTPVSFDTDNNKSFNGRRLRREGTTSSKEK